MEHFIGRKEELAGLKNLLGKNSASLVVIKGRRRIGKSRLAEEFGNSFKKAFFFSGLPPASGTTSRHQKEEFVRQMNELRIPRLMGEDWGDLFRDVARHCQAGKCLIVLDEISWMGMNDPTFLGKLKNAWDRQFTANPDLIMILSGSQSTWIEKNILNSSGFVGRISHQLTLEELALSECNEFWGPRREMVSPYEKLKILAITGGVPRYIEEIQPRQSAEENIKRLCFQREGFLFNEFDQIFSDLFSQRSEKYKTIVQRLADGPCVLGDMTRALGRHRKGRSKGGDISEFMDDLVKTGFVSRDFSWDMAKAKPSRLSQYRLSDNYVRFYLKYIDPNKNKISSGLAGILPSSWLSVMGLQFENLVLGRKNRPGVYRLLNIPIEEILWSNPFFQTKTGQRKGCQIDWLIQTKYNTLYVCEIKFKRDEIGMEAVHEMRQKISALKIPRNFSVRPVLIHVNGVAHSVAESEFFASIVDFARLLED